MKNKKILVLGGSPLTKSLFNKKKKPYLIAILIPTIDSRSHMLPKLLELLDEQIVEAGAKEEIVIIVNQDAGEKPIGVKRNELLEAGTSQADYVAFFDDDDCPGDNYIKHILTGARHKYDCCSLRGVMLTDGTNPEIFEHSIKYNAWRTTPNGVKYERYPNHLNCIKSEIAQRFKFPELDHGEDRDWSTQIHKAGAIKSEYWAGDIIYIYQYNSKK